MTTTELYEDYLAKQMAILIDPDHPEFSPSFCLELAATCDEVGCEWPDGLETALDFAADNFGNLKNQ